MKKSKWALVITILITYLIVSKILYWIDTASGVLQGDFTGAWNAIVIRVLGRDLPLLLAVIGFVLIHKLKGKLWVKIALGYVATVGILFLYIFTLVAIGMMSVMSYLSLFIYYTVSYAIINLVLILKDVIKRKSKMEGISFVGKAKKEEVDDEQVA